MFSVYIIGKAVIDLFVLGNVSLNQSHPETLPGNRLPDTVVTVQDCDQNQANHDAKVAVFSPYYRNRSGCIESHDQAREPVDSKKGGELGEPKVFVLAVSKETPGKVREMIASPFQNHPKERSCQHCPFESRTNGEPPYQQTERSPKERQHQTQQQKNANGQ